MYLEIEFEPASEESNLENYEDQMGKLTRLMSLINTIFYGNGTVFSSIFIQDAGGYRVRSASALVCCPGKARKSILKQIKKFAGALGVSIVNTGDRPYEYAEQFFNAELKGQVYDFRDVPKNYFPEEDWDKIDSEVE